MASVSPASPVSAWSKMNTMQKIYFVSAWVVAGCAVLALIFLAVAYSKISGLLAFSAVLECIYIGTTACFVLLHMSGWFRNSLIIFMMAWIVAGLAFLGMILGAGANLGGAGTVAALFGNIAKGGFCTLTMLYFLGQAQGTPSLAAWQRLAPDFDPASGGWPSGDAPATVGRARLG